MDNAAPDSLIRLIQYFTSPGWRRNLAAGLLALSSLASAKADNFPPLNAEPSTEQHPGKFEWADLFADHAEKEAAFYSKLFDWIPTKIEQNHHLVMLMSIGTQPVASIVQRPLFKRGAGPARWVGYAAVADVFAALASVEKAKGKVLAKLRDVPERGEQAIVSDRDGAIFGLIHSKSGDVPDYQAVAGEFAWAEVFSLTPQVTVDFYKNVLGYDSVVDSSHDDQNHFLLATGEIARAGVAPSPPWKDKKADWLLFVCVANADQMAKKASSLGATVLVGPHTSQHGGKLAIIADPEGGLVGLIELETATGLKGAP